MPPKYAPADFLRASYWSHRGKLDVPKERFISYPDASPDSDATLLLGWAGWDHKDQVQALVNVINDRTEQAGWDTPRLMPLIAGIQELMPWVHQWHGQHDEEWAVTRPRSTRRTWKSSAESTGSRRRTLGPGAGRRRHVAGRRRPTEARVQVRTRQTPRLRIASGGGASFVCAQPWAANFMKAAQPSEATRRIGPALSLESRT